MRYVTIALRQRSVGGLDVDVARSASTSIHWTLSRLDLCQIKCGAFRLCIASAGLRGFVVLVLVCKGRNLNLIVPSALLCDSQLAIPASLYSDCLAGSSMFTRRAVV